MSRVGKCNMKCGGIPIEFEGISSVFWERQIYHISRRSGSEKRTRIVGMMVRHGTPLFVVVFTRILTALALSCPDRTNMQEEQHERRLQCKNYPSK